MNIDDIQEEGWKSTVGGLAAAAAIGAAVQGTPPSTGSITRGKVDWQQTVAVIDGREFIKHALPADLSKAKITTDDRGRKIYAWVEKSGMRPQYTYYWWAPINEDVVSEGWKSTAAAVALAAATAAGPSHGIALNANRVIDGRGNTAADPYKADREKAAKKKAAEKVDATTMAAPAVKKPVKESLTFLRFLNEGKTVQIEKGLTRDEAMKAAPWKSSYGDCRGFSYNPKTGKATWV